MIANLDAILHAYNSASSMFIADELAMILAYLAVPHSIGMFGYYKMYYGVKSLYKNEQFEIELNEAKNQLHIDEILKLEE